MYSRNITRKQTNFRPASQMKSVNNAVEGQRINDTGTNAAEKTNINASADQGNNKVETNVEKTLPVPPPNYRGMIYEIEEITEKAEGIDRLVRNDVSYTENENAKRRRELSQRVKKGERAVFSHTNNEIGSMERESGDREIGGIKRIAEGLSEKKFSPEDVLICALILIMLNGNSEDDILMVLVLMMLL